MICYKMADDLDNLWQQIILFLFLLDNYVILNMRGTL